MYHVNLGGENVLQSVLSKTTFGGLRYWVWSGRCLFPLLFRHVAAQPATERGHLQDNKLGEKVVLKPKYFLLYKMEMT